MACSGQWNVDQNGNGQVSSLHQRTAHFLLASFAQDSATPFLWFQKDETQPLCWSAKLEEWQCGLSLWPFLVPPSLLSVITESKKCNAQVPRMFYSWASEPVLVKDIEVEICRGLLRKLLLFEQKKEGFWCCSTCFLLPQRWSWSLDP